MLQSSLRFLRVIVFNICKPSWKKIKTVHRQVYRFDVPVNTKYLKHVIFSDVARQMSNVKLRGFRGWASLASPRRTRRTWRRWWTRARSTLHGTWRFGYRLGHWSPRGPCARWRSGWFGGRRLFGRLWGRRHFRWLGFGRRRRSFIFDFFGFFSHFFYFFSFFFFYFFFSLWSLALFITYDKNRIKYNHFQ